MTSKKTTSNTTKPTKRKVIATEDKVFVVKFKCPNCGEEEERVVRCSHCETPMKFVDQTQKKSDDLLEDASAAATEESVTSPVVAEADDVPSDPYFDEIVEKGGLGDIFESEGPISEDPDEEESGISMKDITDIIDQDEEVPGGSEDEPEE